jgi:hypothetical protein
MQKYWGCGSGGRVIEGNLKLEFNQHYCKEERRRERRKEGRKGKKKEGGREGDNSKGRKEGRKKKGTLLINGKVFNSD